ncbi:hypothetical protein GEMRC1_008322 [Eukaryota sp. GEM-RC1]
MLLHYSFNSLGTCLGVGTSDGVFECYNCNLGDSPDSKWRGPLISRKVPAGIRIIELLFHSSSIFLVGSSPQQSTTTNMSQWSDCKLRIWSDSQRYVVGELKFTTPIQTVRVNSSLIVVALEDAVWIYRLNDLVSLESFRTSNNKVGAIALTPNQDTQQSCVLACIGDHPGALKIMYISPSDYGTSKTQSITVHKHPIEYIAISECGQFVATAGQLGTIIRLIKIDESHPPTVLWEYRRGYRKGSITSLVFSHNTSFLAAASSRGTIHLFDIRNAVSSASLMVHADEKLSLRLRGLFVSIPLMIQSL